ncbi:class I SAM-dependent methyltransferase [Mycetocola reblochoni]|uniref:class I SAM-dependent methyltransferase n=1 Tax=Mycetocola reblochoni TaxID=331618 RepID=UPI003F9AA4B9
MGDYWNHNTAYHGWILRIAQRDDVRDVLDIGCGDGLLLQRLAPHVTTAVGIEPDAKTIARAHTRLHDAENVSLQRTSFTSFDPGAARFDLIIFVATLHHMELQPALEKAAALLRPGGHLMVVGLAASRTPIDWILSAAVLPLVRIGPLLHRETGDIGVPTMEPRENLTAIRQISGEILPGRKIRRGLYYRYLLTWEKLIETTGSAPPVAAFRKASPGHLPAHAMYSNGANSPLPLASFYRRSLADST